jgi:hypothetical protein
MCVCGRPPPKSKRAANLPPGWKTATDAVGVAYYYNKTTGASQCAHAQTTPHSARAPPAHITHYYRIGLTAHAHAQV